MTNRHTPTALLFVPATRPDRFDKALATGAQLIIDLEDAVHHDDKAVARQIIKDFDKQGKPYWVRTNAPTGLDIQPCDDYATDVALLKNCKHLTGILIPKAQTNTAITYAYEALGVRIIAMIETAAAMADIKTIAQSRGLFALSFGRLDLGTSLGITEGSIEAEIVFDRLRCDMVLYSALNLLARPIETIFTKIDDTDSLILSATHAYQMGFGGQLCIHPKQVACVKACYLPCDDKIAFAQKVAAHFEKTADTVFVIEGMMVDLPIITWAKTTLAALKNQA